MSIDPTCVTYGLVSLGVIQQLSRLLGLVIVLRGSKPAERAAIVQVFGEAWRPWTPHRGKRADNLPPEPVQDLNRSQEQLTDDEITEVIIGTDSATEARLRPPIQTPVK
jgi:hypothetical protein